jgi:hypothetical protein
MYVGTVPARFLNGTIAVIHPPPPPPELFTHILNRGQAIFLSCLRGAQDCIPSEPKAEPGSYNNRSTILFLVHNFLIRRCLVGTFLLSMCYSLCVILRQLGVNLNLMSGCQKDRTLNGGSYFKLCRHEKLKCMQMDVRFADPQLSVYLLGQGCHKRRK